jgi:hypothetical protein
MEWGQMLHRAETGDRKRTVGASNHVAVSATLRFL